MINFAVIGRNFIVDWFLAAASEFSELRFLGVYSRTPEAALEFANKNNAEKIYNTIDEMCNDPELDMVYIASPNICHEEQALKLLSAQKHVFCEKPSTLSYKSLKKMLAAAEENNCVFMEGLVPLHMPAFEKIKSLLTEIGAVRHISFSFCQYSSRYDKFKQGIKLNTFDPTLGNGAFMDLGIYCIEFMIALFGYPEKISGAAHFLPQSIDAVGNLSILYTDKTADITFSKISNTSLPSQIQGENGCILIDSMSRPKKITLVKKDGEKIEFDTTTKRHEMSYELETFIKQLKGEKISVYNKISLLAMKFCDEARDILGIDFKIH